ncbi:MAG: metallophosphoesterase [Flavobacteriales bacterium]|nr:metallophosphoesterase [Flavobacteriales bacterium]
MISSKLKDDVMKISQRLVNRALGFIKVGSLVLAIFSLNILGILVVTTVGCSSSIAQIEKADLSSFVVIGHCYPLLTEGNPDQVKRFIEKIEELKPQAIIFTGDAIMGLYGDKVPTDSVSSVLQSQFSKLILQFSKLNVPIWMAPGNHELVSPQRGYEVIEKEYLNRFESLYHTKTLNGNSFIMLNTINVRADYKKYKYTIDEEQADWLEKELSDIATENNFIFLHHPLWYSGGSVNPSNGKMPEYPWFNKIHPLLKGKVNYVFAGDGGFYGNLLFYEKVDNVHYYISGSDKRRASFLEVVVSDSDVDVRPHFIPME